MIDKERFWKHVMLSDDGPDACWIWTGAQRFDGIGRFFLPGCIERRANRAAYELEHGPVPPGMQLRQTCGSPQCVRHWTPDRPHRKLDERSVTCILASKMPSTKLARMYNVTRQRIYQIRKRTCLTMV